MKPAECGTYAGWSRHSRAKESPCDACRAARAVYNAHRRQDPAVKADDGRRARARARALSRLSREYPARYRALLHEEMQR